MASEPETEIDSEPGTVDDVESDVDTPGPDEVFCTDCGDVIKEKAEVCPNCGVRQQSDQQPSGSLPDSKRVELQNVAGKDAGTVMAISFLLTPAGYLMVGRTGLAILNFFTLNYFFLGFLIVPFHTRSIIREARETLEREGYNW